MEVFRKARDELEELIKQFAAEGIQEDMLYFSREAPVYEQRDDFGQTLTHIREDEGRSRAEFAELLDVNENFLERAEKNEIKPSKYFVHRLAMRTGKNYDDVVNSLYVLD